MYLVGWNESMVETEKFQDRYSPAFSDRNIRLRGISYKYGGSSMFIHLLPRINPLSWHNLARIKRGKNGRPRVMCGQTETD